MNNIDIFEHFKVKNKKMFNEMGVDISTYDFTIINERGQGVLNMSKFIKNLPNETPLGTSMKGIIGDQRVNMLGGPTNISHNLEGIIINRSKNFLITTGIVALSFYTFFLLLF